MCKLIGCLYQDKFKGFHTKHGCIVVCYLYNLISDIWFENCFKEDDQINWTKIYTVVLWGIALKSNATVNAIEKKPLADISASTETVFLRGGGENSPTRSRDASRSSECSVSLESCCRTWRARLARTPRKTARIGLTFHRAPIAKWNRAFDAKMRCPASVKQQQGGVEWVN